MNKIGFISELCLKKECCLSKCQVKQAHDVGLVMTVLTQEGLSRCVFKQSGSYWSEVATQVVLWLGHISL